jgi:hypothetical protein
MRVWRGKKPGFLTEENERVFYASLPWSSSGSFSDICFSRKKAQEAQKGNFVFYVLFCDQKISIKVARRRAGLVFRPGMERK